MPSALSVTQPTPTCGEHELVAAVRSGSDRAFEELYSRYRSRIAGYVFGMVGDHGRAEDITQEVFISALRRLRQTERAIAFKPWIYEIAKNACIDEFRRTRRAREVPLDPTDDRSHTDRMLISSDPTPDAAVEGKQSIQNLTGAFRGLSENHHKVIVMREFEGLSYNQIGEKLGMTRPVVESTLFRARRKLSAEYDDLVTGRRCEHVQTLIAGEHQPSLIKLGIRQRRQLARHLSHCQPCRRHARTVGIDDSLFRAPGLAGKIAALLPFPWLRCRHSSSDRGAPAAAGSHPIGSLSSFQTIAQVAGIVVPSSGLGRAAAAAAGLAMAGIGGGSVAAIGAHPPARTGLTPAHAAPAHRLSAAANHRAVVSADANGSAASRAAARGRRAAGGQARGSRGSTAGGGGASHTTATTSSGSGGSAAPNAGSARSSSGSSGSSPARHAGTSVIRIGVPTSGLVSGGSVRTPSVTAGKVGLPGVKVTPPQLPKVPAPTPSTGSQSTGTQGVVGGAVGGVKGTVQGATGGLPKVPTP